MSIFLDHRGINPVQGSRCDTFSYAEVREKRRCKGHNLLMRKCISAITFHICCQIWVKMDIRHLHIL